MRRASPAAVGAFVVGAVVLAVIAVAAFGSGRLFRHAYPYVIYFTGDVNGLKIGAPVKFKFNKFSLFVGRDLLTFKIAKFAPFVEDTLATEALVAADEVGVAQDVGHLRIIGGIQYTLKPKMTITGEAGFLAFDFKGDQAAQLIRASLTLNKKKLDYGARLGIDDLDNATETLNLALFAALRI